jgi:hypothetical protein
MRITAAQPKSSGKAILVAIIAVINQELRPLRVLPSYGSLGFARLFSDFTQIKRTHVP